MTARFKGVRKNVQKLEEAQHVKIGNGKSSCGE
jgi:hypothetical protein